MRDYTMHFSIFKKSDLITRLKISQIEKSKINVEDNVVLIRGLLFARRLRRSTTRPI